MSIKFENLTIIGLISGSSMSSTGILMSSGAERRGANLLSSTAEAPLDDDE